MNNFDKQTFCRLNLPAFDIKIRNISGQMSVLDPLRCKYVSLTPEEWVRQHFIHFLVHYKGFSPTLIGNEVELSSGDKKMRCDSVVYDRSLRPRIIIEYKKPSIKITQKVFDQISVYNHLLHVDYLIVSNGMTHYCCRMDYASRGYVFIHDIPSASEITPSYI